MATTLKKESLEIIRDIIMQVGVLKMALLKSYRPGIIMKVNLIFLLWLEIKLELSWWLHFAFLHDLLKANLLNFESAT